MAGLDARKIFCLVCIFLCVPLLVSFLGTFPTQVSAEAQTGPVVIANFNVPVDPGSSTFMSRVVNYAISQDASAIVIEMNTPGGLLSDMVSIINSITQANKSGIPTYTYVVPNGLAASAGSYIAMATNKIVMGSGSMIGPSTPIVVGGTSLEQNHTQAAMLEFMVSLANEWGRNSTMAYSMVQGDQAFTAAEAYQYHLIDGLNNSLNGAIDEFNSSLSAKQNDEIVISENVYEQFLSALSDSTLDGILIILGVIAIVIDILHPTIFLTIVGAIAIVLGLIGAEIISASVLGYAVIAIAAVLIVLELKLGHGFAMMAGVVLGAFGIILLAYGLIYFAPSPITLTTELEELFFVAIVGIVAGLYIRWVLGPIRSRSKLTGPEALVGQIGTAVTDLKPTGEVRAKGIIWKAESISGDIVKGESVRVKAVKGLMLEVEKD